MNLEIERKFLVKDPSVINLAESFDNIIQGYFKTEKGISIRVRLKNNRALICIKGRVELDNGLVRNEFEYEIPFADGEFMLKNFCKNRVVSKKRYYLKQGDLTWEVDQFSGRHAPLIIAEIELPSTNLAIDLPDWCGEEVSDHPEYTNQYLAFN